MFIPRRHQSGKVFTALQTANHLVIIASNRCLFRRYFSLLAAHHMDCDSIDGREEANDPGG